MNEEVKEQIGYVLSLLKMILKDNNLGVGIDKRGNILFFDSKKYRETGSIKDCDGIAVNIKEFVE